MKTGFRRLIVGGIVAAAAPAAFALPVAGAKPNLDPCNPHVVNMVSDQVNGYLNHHPDVNQSLIDINNNQPGQAGEGFRSYFDQHPDVASELRALRGPLNDLQCVNTSLPPQVVNALKAL